MSTVPLKEFIELEFNGSQKDFAEWFETSQSQVSRWLSYGCIYYDSSIYKKQASHPEPNKGKAK